MSLKYNAREQTEINAFVIADLLDKAERLQKRVDHLESLHNMPRKYRRQATLDELFTTAIVKNIGAIVKLIVRPAKRR